MHLKAYLPTFGYSDFVITNKRKRAQCESQNPCSIQCALTTEKSNTSLSPVASLFGSLPILTLTTFASPLTALLRWQHEH